MVVDIWQGHSAGLCLAHEERRVCKCRGTHRTQNSCRAHWRNCCLAGSVSSPGINETTTTRTGQHAALWIEGN